MHSINEIKCFYFTSKLLFKAETHSQLELNKEIDFRYPNELHFRLAFEFVTFYSGPKIMIIWISNKLHSC